MATVAEAIENWGTFYAAVAGVGATLVGLVYVGITVHLGRHVLDERTRLLGTMSGVNLLHPVLAALVMLMPVDPRIRAGGLFLVALFALGGTVSIAAAETRHPAGQVRQMVSIATSCPCSPPAFSPSAPSGCSPTRSGASTCRRCSPS